MFWYRNGAFATLGVVGRLERDFGVKISLETAVAAQVKAVARAAFLLDQDDLNVAEGGHFQAVDNFGTHDSRVVDFYDFGTGSLKPDFNLGALIIHIFE